MREVIPAKKITKGSQTAGSEEEGREGGQKGTKGNLFLSFFTERVRRRKPSERGAVHSDRGQEQSNFIRVRDPP